MLGSMYASVNYKSSQHSYLPYKFVHYTSHIKKKKNCIYSGINFQIIKYMKNM